MPAPHRWPRPHWLVAGWVPSPLSGRGDLLQSLPALPLLAACLEVVGTQ